jgi:FlaA1/EpsC-like NDP-sugar epimerase
MVLIPALAAGIAVLFFDWQWSLLDVQLPNWLPGVEGSLFKPSKNNLTDELALSIVLLGSLIMCFSAEKQEDEFIRHTRLQSIQWAVLINYAVLLMAVWLVYNENFWYVMILSMLTIPFIFLLRFHWVLYRQNQKEEDGL